MTLTPQEILESTKRLEQYRHICGKHIFIIEGPAGAGKTELLERLDKISPEIDIVRRSLGKREFGQYEAGAKSFLNDNTKFMKALLSRSSVVFIDRCVASQKVYHAIRTDRNINVDPPPHHVPILMLDELERDLAWRLDRTPRRIKVYWLFLIPSADALRERRKTGGKEYPNRVEDEIYHYKSISNYIIMEQRDTLRPSYEHKLDQSFIVKAFKKWLEYFPHLTFSELWRSFATVERELPLIKRDPNYLKEENLDDRY